MKMKIYPIILFSLTVPFWFLSHTHAEEIQNCDIRGAWDSHYPFVVFSEIQHEYKYYDEKYGDSHNFPKEREQGLLNCVENKYFKKATDTENLFSSLNFRYAPPAPFIKLFLYHGFDIFKNDSADNLYLVSAVYQGDFKHINIPALTHKEIVETLYPTSNISYLNKVWMGNMPKDIAINLAKLFLSLGVHADKNDYNDIVTSSLYQYAPEQNGGDFDSNHFKPDEKHRADDIQKPTKDSDGNDVRKYEFSITFYRSPVTYWLEEFIAAGYPASMLDTHKLHYPHFMKDASVAQVTEMLKNPDAHKIPTNQNCPYKAEAMDCPLTPSINMRDAMGRTPLHIAGEQGNKAVFDALITIGADTNLKDYRGNVPKL